MSTSPPEAATDEYIFRLYCLKNEVGELYRPSIETPGWADVEPDSEGRRFVESKVGCTSLKNGSDDPDYNKETCKLFDGAALGHLSIRFQVPTMKLDMPMITILFSMVFFYVNADSSACKIQC